MEEATLEDLQAISSSTSKEELLQAVLRAASRYGFTLVRVMCTKDGAEGEKPQVIDISNRPQGYEEASCSAEDAMRDPTIMRGRFGPGVPFSYDRQTYMAAGLEHLWHQQARFGYKTGVGTSLRLDKGMNLVFGMDREEPLPTNTSELTAILGYTQMLATYIQAAVARLMQPAQGGQAKPIKLTEREREVLQWAAAGKTAWETAQILKISQSAVIKYRNSAAGKLNCKGKAQAVAKAFALNLL